MGLGVICFDRRNLIGEGLTISAYPVVELLDAVFSSGSLMFCSLQSDSKVHHHHCHDYDDIFAPHHFEQ